MECGSCGELIPDDSIFCPECGARQDMSRAGGFTNPNSVGLSGQEVSGGRLSLIHISEPTRPY